MNSHRTHDRAWDHAMAHIHRAQQLLHFGGRLRLKKDIKYYDDDDDDDDDDNDNDNDSDWKQPDAQSKKTEYIEIDDDSDDECYINETRTNAANADDASSSQPSRRSSTRSKETKTARTASHKAADASSSQPSRRSSTRSKETSTARTASPSTGASSSRSSRRSSTQSKETSTARTASPKAAAKGKAQKANARSSQPSRQSSTQIEKTRTAVSASPKASGKAAAKGKAEPSTASSSQPSRHPIIKELRTKMGNVDDKEIITGMRNLNKNNHLAILRTHPCQDGHRDSILQEHMKLLVDSKAVATKEWIHSESVDTFFAMLENEDNKNLFMLSGFWIDYVSETPRYAPKIIKRYRKHFFAEDHGCKIAKISKIIVPINHTNDHWTLGVLDVKAKKIRYYDPISEEANRFPAKIEQLKNFARELLGIEMSIEYKNEYERQENGHDCGPFMCMYAYVESKYSSDNYVKPDINQKEIKAFRLFMAHTIFSAITLKSGEMIEWVQNKHLPPETRRGDGIMEHDLTGE